MFLGYNVLSLFAEDAILFEDEVLLVTTKPSGLPTQGADPSLASDWGQVLKQRSGSPDLPASPSAGKAYLATPFVLARDASGVAVFLKQKALFHTLKQALENAKFSWSVGAERLVSLPHSHARSTPTSPREWEQVENVGPRFWMRKSTGPSATNELRAALPRGWVLASMDNCPEQVSSTRCLAHLEHLTMVHPVSGKKLALHSPTPLYFRDWLTHGTLTFPDQKTERVARIQQALAFRCHLFNHPQHTAFRLVHGEADGLPGVMVDWYDGWVVLQVLSPEAQAAEQEIADTFLALGAKGVYLKRRPKQANVVVDTRVEQYAPHLPLSGEQAPDTMEVLENNIKYLVKLNDGLSTGIFLDQRDNRRWVQEHSSGKQILNLFAYTCPFTMAAVAGGASSTVSVDISKPVLDWGEQNLAHNFGESSGKHAFVREESLTYLKRAKVKNEQFDGIILDPPSFATTKNARFSVQENYVDLLVDALRVLRPRGWILACTNHRKMNPKQFRRFAEQAAQKTGVHWQKIQEVTPPSDFPSYQGRPHLKCLRLQRSLVHVLRMCCDC
jgi:23S rRNA (cytosine1962-C5)-methyltransferase